MGKAAASGDTGADERRAKALLRSIGNLDADLLEDISISAEQELATRTSEAKGELTHIHEIHDQIEEAAKLWGKVSGISTGYPSLDAKIGGLKPGELILVAGETNNGKSALAQNIAVNVAKQHGVLFITLEMLMTEAGSRIRHMNKGTIDDLDLMFQTEYQIDYRNLDALFASGIAAGVKFVVLDYLQYLGRGMTLEEVAKMSKLMKSLALKYKIPFMVIVSLRKSGMGKQNSRPWTTIETDDLMGTGAIGYDADVALVASRKNLDGEFANESLFVKVIKARNMAQNYDERFLTFVWDNTRITEWNPAQPNIQGGRAYKE